MIEVTPVGNQKLLASLMAKALLVEMTIEKSLNRQ